VARTCPVAQEIREPVVSLACYGVAVRACGNTIKSLHWTGKNLLKFASAVPLGVDGRMKRQEDGFAYVSW